jgi:beta-N-acetylhexosaminidase
VFLTVLTVESPAVLRGSLLLILALAIVAIAKFGVFDSDPAPSGDTSAELTRQAAEVDGGNSEELPVPLALGQMIVGRFAGEAPPAAFLRRIERGQLGGVILFEEHFERGEVATGRLTKRLQSAARRGHNPPLLIMVDQEGGEVKRLPGPPTRSAHGMTAADDAREQGEATGYLLRRIGVNVDLAPVADVGHPGSFLGSRAFSSAAAVVAEQACEFAGGLRDQGVAATLKHFPGLGRAGATTDESAVTIDATAGAIRADYAPYRACAAEPLTLVMVGSAIYPTLTGSAPAVMSPLTYSRELPKAGASGVTISDALETPAIESHTTPARRSIVAGLDLLLYAKTEAAAAEAYGRLLEDVRRGAIKRQRVREAAAAIVALKRELAS